jgi:hypothetical protein
MVLSSLRSYSSFRLYKNLSRLRYLRLRRYRYPYLYRRYFDLRYNQGVNRNDEEIASFNL